MKKNIIQNYLQTVSAFMHGKEKSAIRAWRLAQRPFVSQSHLKEHKTQLGKKQLISDATLLSIKGEQLLKITQIKLQNILNRLDKETKQKVESIMLSDEELMCVLGNKTQGNLKFSGLDLIVNQLMFYNKQLIAAEIELKHVQAKITQSELKQDPDLMQNNRHKRKRSPSN